MYDFTMPKIKDLLKDLENATATSSEFVRIKVGIQDELYKMTDSISDPELNQAVVVIYAKWRKLGGADGTLRGYMNAIDDLKVFLDILPA